MAEKCLLITPLFVGKRAEADESEDCALEEESVDGQVLFNAQILNITEQNNSKVKISYPLMSN